MRIITVGSGWTGLYALKWLKEEFRVKEQTNIEQFKSKQQTDKIQLITLEKEGHIGGVWKYKENEDGGVFKGTCSTSSKAYMHPSDFPFPEEYPHFPHHSQIWAHLKNYAEHFNLFPFISYHKSLLSIEKNEAENIWELRVRDTETQEVFELYCDKLVLAVGQHQNPNWTPLFRKYQHHNSPHLSELLEVSKERVEERAEERVEEEVHINFSGTIIHSHQYKYPTPDMYGKNVLVIGGGESASDIANEVSTVSNKCYLSIRHGVWFHDRGVGGQQPADILFTRHQRAAGNYESFPIWLGRYLFIEVVWGKGGSGVPEWQPAAQYLHGFINKSRDVISRVSLGYVIPKREIKKIEGNLVYFSFPNKEKYIKGEEELRRKEREEEEGCHIDVIILATGYQSNIRHLFHNSKYPTRGDPKYNFKLVFDVNDPSLAYVGSVRPVFGSIPGLAELQARWVAKVFSGKLLLPRPQRMKRIVRRDIERHRRLYPVDDYRLYQLNNHFEYSDEIARWMGVLPNIPLYLFKNPSLWWTLITSPWTPFQYLLKREKIDEFNTKERQEKRIESAVQQIKLSIDRNHYALIFFNNLVLVIDVLILIVCIVAFLLFYYFYFMQ